MITFNPVLILSLIYLLEGMGIVEGPASSMVSLRPLRLHSAPVLWPSYTFCPGASVVFSVKAQLRGMPLPITIGACSGAAASSAMLAVERCC